MVQEQLSVVINLITNLQVDQVAVEQVQQIIQLQVDSQVQPILAVAVVAVIYKIHLALAVEAVLV